MTTEKITYLGIDMEIEGTYYPGEPQISYDSDMAGYPGSPSEFEIYDVFVEEVSILNLLQDFQLEDIQTEVLEKIEG
jgi:hypothetical protein